MSRMRVLRWLALLAPVIILGALTTATWFPALFEGRTLIHGDSVTMGVVQARVHAEAFAGLRPLSWTREIYGGHPYFAEGQGGFTNPLNIFFAALIAPNFGVITAVNWLHWTYMIVASVGFIGLARTLGLSASAQVVGGVAMLFSSLWVHFEQNSTIAAAMATTPWTLWAVEVWLRRPSFSQALLLGAAGAWMVFAGYPHIAYGAGFYAGVRVACGLLQPVVRAAWLNNWRTRALTGAIALVFCVGTSAIQLLPLLELASLSARQSGTALMFTPLFDMHVRGATYWPPDQPSLPQAVNAGSLLVCILASLAPLLDRRPVVVAHFAAVSLLVILGLGPASPLFGVIYDNHLLPGLHLFRVLSPFLLVALVGAALLAGFSADAIARMPMAARGAQALLAGVKAARFWLSLLVVGIWVALTLKFGFGPPPHLSLWFAGAAGLILVGVCAVGRLHWIAPLLACVLCLDAGVQRVNPYVFFNSSALTPPAEAQTIQTQPNWPEYRHAAITGAQAFGFIPEKSPRVATAFARVKSNIVTNVNILWGIPSMNGSLGLPLARRSLLDQIFEREWTGQDSTPAGLRMMDLLSIRFLSFDRRVSAPGYRVLQSSRGVWLFENIAARPRFQIYADYVEVRSPEEALPILDRLIAPLLVVETAPDAAPLPALDARAASEARYRLLEDRGDHYRVRVSTPTPVWLFLADAPYPGWRARIDGATAPLYPAQILGKAVLVPAGEHDVIIEFRSAALQRGAFISISTLVLALLTLCAIIWRNRRGARSSGV